VKIAAVRVTPIRLRFAQPVRTAHGEFAERESVLLELRDADGLAGYGEAAPWPGFATESAAEAQDALRRLGGLLPGATIEPGEQPTAAGESWADRPAARAALQGALLDLGARRAGRPLAAYLAARAGSTCGAPLSGVAANCLLTGRDPGELHAQARRAQASGYRAVKVKLGSASLATDVARVGAVREGVGPTIRLRADANGAWSVREALAALAALAPFDLEYVEQPVAAGDIAGLAQVRRGSAVRVAADESVASEGGMLKMLAAAAVDVVVLKPATLGGAERALELAAGARQAGMEVVFTHALESAVGARHALHCAAAWGDGAGVHGLVTAGLFAADVAAPLECRGGTVAVPDLPGIGVTP